MTETALRDVLEKLEQTLAGLILEVKGMRTHGASAGDFLQVAVEDVQKALTALKQEVLR